MSQKHECCSKIDEFVVPYGLPYERSHDPDKMHLSAQIMRHSTGK